MTNAGTEREEPTSPRGPLRIAGYVGGGAAICLPFIWPVVWPLAWIALAPLFLLAPHERTPGSAARGGLWMGTATVFPAFIWLVDTIHVFGGFPVPIALFFYSALTLWGASQFALVALVLQRAGPRAPFVLGPATWVASEFLYPNLFPWRLAHSQIELPTLLQIGDLTGPYGLSFVIALVAASLAHRHPRTIATAAALLLATIAYGQLRLDEVRTWLADAPESHIGIVQGNLSLTEKRNDSRFESNVERYRRLSRNLEPTPDLIVWPETVVEWGIYARATQLSGRVDPFPDAPAPLLFGALTWERDDAGTLRWRNSALLRRTDGRVDGRYDKVILMPFGEFLPFAETFPWIKSLSPNTGDFLAGEGPVRMDLSEDLRLGPLICYEDIITALPRATVELGATVLITVANDAWFGQSAALWQHEMLDLWRAIETRRYLVRATNTGLSSVVAPTGEVVRRLPVATETAASVRVQPLGVMTPYQRLGDLFAWCTVVLALGALLSSRRPG